MSRPTLYLFQWSEEEPTAPGGGRIRYTVEAIGPDPDLGEECVFVHVSEDCTDARGEVYSRDAMTLDARDLGRMIDCLKGAQAAVETAEKRSHGPAS